MIKEYSADVEHVRFFVILIVCLLLITSCSILVFDAYTVGLDERVFRLILMTNLSYYSPIIMLLVGHFVATSKDTEQKLLNINYLLLLSVIGTIYVITPILCFWLAPSYQKAMEYTSEVGGVFSLPLFLLLGLIFTNSNNP